MLLCAAKRLTYISREVRGAREHGRAPAGEHLDGRISSCKTSSISGANMDKTKENDISCGRQAFHVLSIFALSPLRCPTAWIPGRSWQDGCGPRRAVKSCLELKPIEMQMQMQLPGPRYLHRYRLFASQNKVPAVKAYRQASSHDRGSESCW